MFACFVDNRFLPPNMVQKRAKNRTNKYKTYPPAPLGPPGCEGQALQSRDSLQFSVIQPWYPLMCSIIQFWVTGPGVCGSVVWGLIAVWWSTYNNKWLSSGPPNRHFHPPTGMCSGPGALPPGSLFGLFFRHRVWLFPKLKMTLKMIPKMWNMKLETMPQKSHIPRYGHFMICMNLWSYVFWKSTEFSIRSTNFTYPSFSRSLAASPKNTKIVTQQYTPKHPKIQQHQCSKNNVFLASMQAWF